MIEGNTNRVPKQDIVTFGELQTDNNRNIEFPPEKANKKIIKSWKEIWQEASDTITIKASDNTAEILKQLEDSKVHKDALEKEDSDIVH